MYTTIKILIKLRIKQLKKLCWILFFNSVSCFYTCSFEEVEIFKLEWMSAINQQMFSYN